MRGPASWAHRWERSIQEVTVQQLSGHVNDPPFPPPGRPGLPPSVPLSSENLRNFRWVASRRDKAGGTFARAIPPRLPRPVLTFQVSRRSAQHACALDCHRRQVRLRLAPPLPRVTHVATPPTVWGWPRGNHDVVIPELGPPCFLSDGLRSWWPPSDFSVCDGSGH